MVWRVEVNPGGENLTGFFEIDGLAGEVVNAATVIAGLHAADKRPVFCESRPAVEELGALLRDKGVTTFLSHTSLSADERRRSELAFAEGRDCVIVSTSTLELGIDVGDLDRVIQIDSLASVASFLQRLGRTGRRADTSPQLPLPRRRRGIAVFNGGLALESGGPAPLDEAPRPRSTRRPSRSGRWCGAFRAAAQLARSGGARPR